jgi:hypothetical protein
MTDGSNDQDASRGSQDLPDPASHDTGWSARLIDGVWCIGMTGNLDTIHDAVVRVNRHGSDQEAADIARWIAATYSDAVRARALHGSQDAGPEDARNASSAG